MLHIFVHLYVIPDQIETFRAYETAALRIFRKHGGELITAVRPILNQPDAPFEIHHLTIDSEEAFKAFRQDPDHKALADMRQQCMSHTDIYLATQEITYS